MSAPRIGVSGVVRAWDGNERTGVNAAEYVRVAQEAFGAFNAMMARLSPQERESAWKEVEESLRRFASGVRNCSRR